MSPPGADPGREAADAGRPVDRNLIALLEDVITELQASYPVTTETGETFEVELPRWQYKPVSNYLRLPDGQLARFAPPDQVAAEMARLTGELGSPEFAGLHPVVQATYAHYALTAVHPFADGNGLRARTVASIYLMRAYPLPPLIFADQWPGYYQALRAATQGLTGRRSPGFSPPPRSGRLTSRRACSRRQLSCWESSGAVRAAAALRGRFWSARCTWRPRSGSCYGTALRG